MTTIQDKKDKQLDRYRQEHDWFEFLRQMLEPSERPEDQLQVANIKTILASYEKIIECVEQDKPFLASAYASAPEIYTAMDIPWYMIMATSFLASAAPYVATDIDNAENIGLGSDFCTAMRLAINCVESGITPIPTAVVGMVNPCDGAPMLHQVILHNKD